MRVFVLTGPTGVGKSDVAVVLARRLKLEIISVDARQVYRHLDIGTAKPPKVLREEIKFHMVDVVEPTQLYSSADYARDTLPIIRALRDAKRLFILVGGAGFYLRALFAPLFEVPRFNPVLRERFSSQETRMLYHQLQKVDPERAAQLHPNDRQRIIRALEIYRLTGRRFSDLIGEKKEVEFIPIYVVLNMPRSQLYRRIDERFDQMMTAGLLDEVRRIKAMGLATAPPVITAYGYAELLAFLDGKLSLDEAIALAKKKTRDYARRQLTWFRSLKDARWFDVSTPEETAEKLIPILLDVIGSDV